MKFGLFGINMGIASDPAASVRVAQAAEVAGFESIWTGEHVVLPDPQAPPSPLPPHYPMLDPTVALAFLAGQTRTIKLGTGIIILPQRNPLVLAKELASLDVVSGGRLIFGLGIGYLKPEFDTLGIPFSHKGPRSIDYLRAMKAVWTQDEPAHRGEFVSFSDIQSRPQPLQKPHPPVVFGGHTPQAYKRSVRHGTGWFGFVLDVEATAQCLLGIKHAAQQVARPAELGALEISVTPKGRLDANTVKRFAELGVDRLIPFKAAKTEADWLAYVNRTGDELIGKIGKIGKN